MDVFVSALLAALLVALAAGVFLVFLYRPILKGVTGFVLRLLLTESYAKNMWEFVSSVRRFKPLKIAEGGLRAEYGEILSRPLGTPKKLAGFEGLIFLPAQLATLTTRETHKVDTRTVIGPQAKRPLRLEIPLLISGMGAGVPLTEPVKIALAKGASLAGTATNTGQGPLLPEERKAADKLILQYSRAPWAKTSEELKQADMVEIAVGGGGDAGSPQVIPSRRLSGRLRRLMGLNPDEDARIGSRVPGVEHPDDWPKLVKKLREETGGVPIGVKILPSRVEEDIDRALEAGVDVITIDGAQAGTGESATIVQDDFGLPTIRGLCRAVEHLEKRHARQRVSLIVSGGLYTPGDYLKVLALGADAVALGTAVLFAALHTQITKVLPWEPLTQLIWSGGESAGQFDVEKASKYVANFLNASVEEMKLAVICLGKKAVSEVGREDLVALDPETARLTGIPLAYGREDSVRTQREKAPQPSL
ncbi:MAG: FMN-binding glutamate synthase family protein [Thermoactinomycetaceae bacterium]|nr:FMN-binding glutamate synthase family protein [Thermoactinomycetaceae bacterium]